MRDASLSADALIARLGSAGIPFTIHRHEAVFTVAQSSGVTGDIPGGHTKNLFLKDGKGRLFLVVAEGSTRIDLKRLGASLGASGRLSFGSADLLREVLGVEPGSVTPLSVVNDHSGRVSVVVDEALLRHERINVHPLVNTMTVGLALADLLRFLADEGHAAEVAALPSPDENCMALAGPPS